MVKAMDSKMLSTTESGQYVDGDRLSTALGASWKNVLHGDAGDLTNAIHWDANRYLRLDSGKFTTFGSHHNWATWVLFQDIDTGIIFLHVATHLHHTKRGTTAATEGDKIRKQQAEALVKKSLDLRSKYETNYIKKRIPIIFSGDFNQDDDDKFDFVGDVMSKNGFADAEKKAATKTGPDTTYPNIPPHKPSHRRFDRLFVPKDAEVAWMKTIVGPPNSDHNSVGILVTLTNN